MEILRRRLLDSTTKQSDLIEIFAAMDRDRSGRITYEEFRSAIKALRLGINSDDEIKNLFREFDKTNNGQIDLSEFLRQLRPPMNERRQKACLNLFNSLDVDQDEKVTISDLKTKFAAQLQPNKRRTSQSIDQALQSFFKRFDPRGKDDGVIEKDEFLAFCSMLSATVKEDVYFEHVLRTLFEFRI